MRDKQRRRREKTPESGPEGERSEREREELNRAVSVISRLRVYRKNPVN